MGHMPAIGYLLLLQVLDAADRGEPTIFNSRIDGILTPKLEEEWWKR